MSLTKIVVTVGPAVAETDRIVSLIKAGASIFRFNLKYSDNSWHSGCIQKVKEASKIAGQPVSILLDFPCLKTNFSPQVLLEKTLKNFSLASKHEVDFIALSYVRRKKDIELLRNQVEKIFLKTKILAKIETGEALRNFKGILESSDGIMIARGDLGKEIPFERVPYHQKRIIKYCIEAGKPVITATEMLESMIYKPLPTRAEVSDVANAILDYTDAVMLSAETATGKYPLKAVAVMEKICRFWEKARPPISNFDFELDHQTAAICYSAYHLWRCSFFQKENIKAFVVITKTDMTARMLSRLRPKLPILALTEEKKFRDQMCLLYGVTPLLFKEGKKGIYKKRNSADIEEILTCVKKSGHIKTGDKIIIIYAEDWGTPGKTSIVRTQEVS